MTFLKYRVMLYVQKAESSPTVAHICLDITFYFWRVSDIWYKKKKNKIIMHWNKNKLCNCLNVDMF